MDARLSKVHISYKHDTAHEDAVESIKNGLSKNGIPLMNMTLCIVTVLMTMRKKLVSRKG